MRVLALVTMLACSGARAQEEQWVAPPFPPPPPPAEPVPAPPPPMPPPRAVAPRPVPARIPEAPRPRTDVGFRLAPTLSVLPGGVSFEGRGILVPSLRTGLRYALLARSPDEYAFNLGLSLEVGLEGHRSNLDGIFYGFGITARCGPAFITRGGLFFPFFEAYGLVTLTISPTPSLTLITAHPGIGVNFNAFAINSGGWLSGAGGSGDALLLLLALVIPRVELVWSPPTPRDTGLGVVEVRFGIGF